MVTSIVGQKNNCQTITCVVTWQKEYVPNEVVDLSKDFGKQNIKIINWLPLAIYIVRTEK